MSDESAVKTLKIGREYEWQGSETTIYMGKLMAIGPSGLHQWQNGQLTIADRRFVEVKRPLFGGRK